MTTTIMRTQCVEAVNHERDVSGVSDEIAALSHVALSRMMREAHIAIGYQCDDGWVIEQVRHRLLYFVKHCSGKIALGKDAWREYVRNFHEVRDAWKCSYAGSTDYAWGNLGFEVRSFASPDMAWAPGYFDGGIMKQLGCVFRRNSMSDGFPPAEVIAAFPGYTPLSATFDWVPDPGGFLGKRVENWQYVCHPEFESPRHGEKRHGSFTAYMAADWDKIDYERDIRPYRNAK